MFIYLILVFNLFIIIFFTIIDIYKYRISFLEYLQRLSIYSYREPNYDYLIHGSSCGEIISSISIVELLLKKKKKIIVSCNTVSSYRLITKKISVDVILKPYEHIINLCIFYYRFKPKNIIIMESDIWPLFTSIAKLLNIRIIAINYTFKKEKPFRNLIHYYLLDKIYLKEPIDFYNAKYEFLGNIKLLNAGKSQLIVKKRMLTIISAHYDEFEIHRKIITFCLENNIKVVYIPRYLNYESELKEAFKTLNYYWLTDKNKNISKLISNFDLIVCFCYGLTNSFLSHSKLSIMGGTFNQVGGHNIVEPIVNYNYLIMGPNYKTCADLYTILNKHNIISICDVDINERILYFIDHNSEDIANTLLYLEKYRDNLNNRLETILG